MNRFSLSALLLAATIFVAPAAASNLLVDGGFEGTITFDGPPFVGLWEGFSGDGANINPNTAFGTAEPRNGAQHLALTIDNAANSFAGAFQDVTGLVAGQATTYSMWHKLAAGGDGGGEIRIEWRDSVSDTEITRTPNFVPTYTSDYAEFTINEVVPAGADTARLVYAIQSFGGPPSQTVYVDDVSFTAIPEPASMVMFALAGAGLLCSRRRR